MMLHIENSALLLASCWLMADVMIMSEFEAVNVFVSVSGCCLFVVVLFFFVFVHF